MVSLTEKKENSFEDFGSFQPSAEQGSSSFPFQHEPAIFLASVKTTTRDAQPLSHPLAFTCRSRKRNLKDVVLVFWTGFCWILSEFW